MKFFKIFIVSIDFPTLISINWLGSGGSANRTPYKCIFLNFLNVCPIFTPKIYAKNGIKFSKKIEKIAKFSCKFLKNCNFFIDFFPIFWKPPRRWTKLTPYAAPTPPYKPYLAEPRFPPKEFLRAPMIILQISYYFARQLVKIHQ